MPFAVLNDLATGKIDPAGDLAYLESQAPYLKRVLEEHEVSAAFRAPSLRCASLFGYLEQVRDEPFSQADVLDELREVSFDMYQLAAPKTDIPLSEVSQLLLTALAGGKPGAEPLESVLSRIDKALDASSVPGNAFLATHGYLLRVIYALLTVEHANAGSLALEDLQRAPRFDYLEGFAYSKRNGITPLSPHSAA